jgi:hypothetical protein
MTGAEIQNYIEKRIGRSVDPDNVLEAINECLDEIGDMSLLYTTASVNVSDIEQWYALEDDYTKVEKVIIHVDDKDYIYQRWEYRNGSIRMFDEGEYTIVARKMPEHLTEIADSFTDIHRLYHNAIKFYALAWILENDKFDDPAADKYYKRFESKVTRAANTLLSTKPPSKVTVIRHA